MSEEWYDVFDGPLADELPTSINEQSVTVRFSVLEDADYDLAQAMLHNPAETKQAAEDALANHGYPRAAFRVYDIPNGRHYDVGKYRAEMLGSLIAVTGEVVDTDPVEQFAEVAAWECLRCGHIQRMSQPGGDMVKPFGCEGCEENEWSLDVEHSDVIDFQKVLLKRTESTMDDPPVEGVVLWRDLVETVSTGDVVTITGAFEVEPWQSEAELDTHISAVDVRVEGQQPATVDDRPGSKLRRWTYDAVDHVCDHTDGFDASKEAVIERMTDEHAVNEGEVRNTLEDLDERGFISERRNGTRVQITRDEPPGVDGPSSSDEDRHHTTGA